MTKPIGTPSDASTGMSATWSQTFGRSLSTRGSPSPTHRCRLVKRTLRRFRMPRAQRVGRLFLTVPTAHLRAGPRGQRDWRSTQGARNAREPSSTSDAGRRHRHVPDRPSRRFAAERPGPAPRRRRPRVTPAAESRSRVTSVAMMVSARRSPPRAQPIATPHDTHQLGHCARACMRQRGTPRASPRTRRLRRP